MRRRLAGTGATMRLEPDPSLGPWDAVIRGDTVYVGEERYKALVPLAYRRLEERGQKLLTFIEPLSGDRYALFTYVPEERKYYHRIVSRFQLLGGDVRELLRHIPSAGELRRRGSSRST